MTTLYDLGAEWARLESVLIESGGELTPEVEAAFAELGELEAGKIDAYQAVIANLTAYAAGCQREVEKYQEKGAVATNATRRLKDRLKDYMNQRGVTELKGDIWKAVVQRNGGKPPLVLDVPVEQLPSPFVRYTPSADTEEMRKRAFADGRVIGSEGVQLAHIEAPGTHLRFR